MRGDSGQGRDERRVRGVNPPRSKLHHDLVGGLKVRGHPVHVLALRLPARRDDTF